MFTSVLVANRGEIAVRIIRTLRRLGVRSVAVYSDADAGSPHVREADVAVRIGPAAPQDSYMHIERILAAARSAGAEAVHPGYGFLAENAEFARATAAAGLVFVGPSPHAIELMGDKIRAKETVAAAGVPTVPGRAERGMSDLDLAAAADEIGFPVRHASLGTPGDGRDARRRHRRLGPDLVPHQLDGVRGRSHEHQARCRSGPGELGVLGQEPVARMHRLGSGGPRCGEDPLRLDVALPGRRRADPDGDVGLRHMARAGVGIAVDGDGTDAEAPQRAHDADGDLAAVGHQHGGEHRPHIRKTP